MQIVLLHAARRDLRDIWVFGVETWSEAQSDRYSDEFDLAIAQLVENPFLAAPAEGVAPGVRRLLVGSHAVFYRIDDEDILVIRVLHQSRDSHHRVR